MSVELAKTMDYLKSQLGDQAVVDKLQEYIGNLERKVEYIGNKRLEDSERYMNTLEQLKATDYALQNEKKANENNRKALDGFVRENKALRELVSLWA